MAKRSLVLLFALLTACGGAQSSGSLLAQGAEAPNFTAMDQSGEMRQLRALADGHPVVLFFYPKDGTPGCTAEACAFRDAWDRIEATGAVVIGVSTDDVWSHQHFAAEHDLPFPLLADPEEKVLALYGVPSTLGMAARVTFIIDGDGRVARVFPDVDPAVHVTEVLEVLEAL